ncbi:MAG: CAP domain-containing protein [bacterium]|nr:CAP domain-containing protein [bacterium]
MPRNLWHAGYFVFGLWLSLVLLVPLTAPWAFAADPDLARLEGLLARDVNTFRREHHLIELRRRPDLDAVARAHSEDMARRNYLSHQSPEGLDWVARLEAAGVEGFSMAGENVGRTNKPGPNAEILGGWIHSPAHHQNLVARPFNATGIGIARSADGSFVYTQLYLSFPR